MLETGLPLSQVAPVWSQPLGTISASEYPLAGTTLLKVCVFGSVGSESSSSEKLEGLRPPPVVKLKSCGSLGCEDSTITILPRLPFGLVVSATVALAVLLGSER